MKQLGVIGFGQFGQFMVRHLLPHFKVVVFDRDNNLRGLAKDQGVDFVSLKEVAESEIIVIAIPVQYQEELFKEIKDYVQPGALVLDVSSVKIKPIELMKKYLPAEVEIIGTHPIFGPQSGKNGIEGLKIVVCVSGSADVAGDTGSLDSVLASSDSARDDRMEAIINFLKDKLKLEVLLRTPEEHDKEMAYVQGLTHLLGRALNKIDLPDLEMKTLSYQSLLEIRDNLKFDSLELFKTIQKENPYVKKVVEDFVEKVNELNNL